MVTKSNKSDYLDDLDNPSLEPGRRLALILLSYIRDVEAINEFINSESLEFDREIASLIDTLKCVSCGKAINNEGSVIYCSEYCNRLQELSDMSGVHVLTTENQKLNFK
ncbi:MAG: hypothetical protein NMNS01_29210 [Nitrosomonas sp.]|nr:MAG: hypothetical protein NMNS01_29210 [Nitrosomonas sp.]